ncbi:MAG: S8 family serine peptidase, partial [Chitinophagaceae bacterium]
MNQFCSVYILAMLLLFNVTIQAQPVFNFQQKSNHSRPFIQLDSVKNTAFESGRIYVKFTANFSIEKQQQANYLSLFSNNILLKNLQKQFKVQHTHSMFPYILEDIERAELHKSWGFNRWFEIEFDSSFSVKDVVKTYQQTGIFEIVEPVYKTELIGATEYIPNDPFFSQQWHFKNTGQGGGIVGKDIELTKAWEIEKGKPSVLISIHDNALQLDHVDLAQNIAVGTSYNFTDNSPNLTLNSGHGTFCAGIFGAVNNNNIGISSIAGGNGNSNSGIRIMSCQTFSRTRNTGFAESFIYAADNGAAISSNSWGYVDFDVYNVAVLDAIDYFCDNGGGGVMQGGLVVFAAGNNGLNKKIYPGAYERVICVAASNNKDEKANYSNFGDWVDITAPGGEFSGATGVLSLNNFDGYSSSGGTSNACPQVVGVAGLVTSILSGRTSASDVRDILLSTVDNHYSSNQNYMGLLGSGRLNAYKAVLKAKQLLQTQTLQAVSNVNAQLVCNTLNISYTKPHQSNNVIIVYNNTNDISTLVDGRDYSLGDNLIGGGKIGYKGNESSFLQQIANTSDWHYFKIFTVNSSLQYSYGYTIAKATKPLLKGNGIVMTENFNYPYLFPTKEWDNRNKNFVSSWIHTARDTSSTGAGDNFSMGMYNYSFNNISASVDTLFSPYVWVKSADSVQLNFWHSYKYTPKNVQDADSLEVLVSTDCGQTFTSIWKKGGRNLTTTSDSSNSEWYPFAPNSFTLNNIQLNRFSAFEKIMIAFRGYNGGGNNLFIDNISLATKYIQPDQFTTVAVGKNHTLSLTKNGSLWAWGENNVGQLGNEKTNTATSIIKANYLSWINIAAGNDFSVGIAEDSTLWTWGLNNQAQLGNNSVQNKVTPTKISSIINWDKVVCGDSHSLALQSNGNLWSWGLNDKGQLGNSSTINQSTIQQIGNAAEWKTIAAGEKHSLAIKKDGTLWAWGQNDVGQLGDGTNIDKWQPVQIGNVQNWKAIAAGNKHSLAIKTDGTLWAWGQNDEGQLGDNSFINKNNPVQIGSNTNWQRVAAGFKHSMAITTDSSLFTWGLNNLGQLGT